VVGDPQLALADSASIVEQFEPHLGGGLGARLVSLAMRASFVVVVVVVVVGRVCFDPNEDHTPGQARFAILVFFEITGGAY
jgi:hypothetical protein